MAEKRDRGVGGFKILHEIHGGSGSQGTVYKAVCEEDRHGLVPVGTVVALKIMPVQDDTGDQWRKLERRTQELAHLQHPNVVRYYGCFSEAGDFNDLHVVVLEHLNGKTLKQRLKDDFPAGLDVDEGMRIIHEALSALNYTAKSGIIHRDIKPGNVFICDDGAVKLIDFEIARQEGGTSVSVSGNIRGSFDYMAPDFTDPLFHGDEQSDVFSLGVVIHEVLTGKTPYQRLPGDEKQANFAFLARWAKSGDGQTVNPIRISGRIRRLLAHADEVLLRALAPRREDRYPDFASFDADFKKIRFRDLKNGANTYRMLQYIGKGGFGEVFKARLRQTGQLVAVKHLLKDSYADRFYREARTLKKLRDPCFVQFVDFFYIESGDVKHREAFLVMAFLDGMPGNSLRDAIRESGTGLPPKDVFLAFRRYAYGLSLMHGQGIYHRDIKPSNLYYPRGAPDKSAIMDFGIIRDIHGTQTKDGGVPGTFDYMPPEVILTKNRGDARMDIFALGLCLYEALTGKTGYPRLPTGNAALPAFLERAKNGDPPVFDDPRVQGSRDILALLCDMTNPSSEKREGEIRQVVARLRKLALEAGAETDAFPEADEPETEDLTVTEPPTESPTEETKEERPVIGGFEVRAKVHNGSGGTGTVFEAVCVNDSSHLVPVGTRVALKIMPYLGGTKDLWPKLQKITDTLVRLQNPNVVRYYGCFQYTDEKYGSGRYYVVVQEFLEGKSLWEILEEQREKSLPRLDVEEALRIIRAAIHGLQATARAGIVHRDIKPANIFICDDGSVKVIDFEIALQQRQDSGEETTPTTTGDGNMRGSWNYMAPDFLGDGSFQGDIQSDIFSLGVVLYELLAGKLPHAPIGDVGQFGRLWEGVLDGGKESPIHTDRRIEDLLGNGAKVFESALHLDRNLRYPDFESFEKDLRPRELRNGIYTYRILRYVDQGGYATVYEAKRINIRTQRTLEEHVAVKQLENVSGIKKFEQEARMMMKLDGNGCFTRYIDFFQPPLASGRGFLVMEFLDGMPANTLRGAIKRSRTGLSPRDVLFAFARYASGLHVLHEKGIIHRDIKPSNLYYPAGRPEESKIMDLGIARDVDATGTPTPLCGTPDYMPADSRENRDDKSRDIFALGLCLYEALTAKSGYPRLPKNSPWEAWLKQRETPPVFEDPRVRKNKRLLALLEQMTNLVAKKRGTAEDVYKELRRLAVDAGVKENLLPLNPRDDFVVIAPLVPPSDRLRKWALAAGLLVAVSGGSAGILFGAFSFQRRCAAREKNAIVETYKSIEEVYAKGEPVLDTEKHEETLKTLDTRKDEWIKTWTPNLAGWWKRIPNEQFSIWEKELEAAKSSCNQAVEKNKARTDKIRGTLRDADILVERFKSAADRETWEKVEKERLARMTKWDKGLLGENKYKELKEKVLTARNKADGRIRLQEECASAAKAVEEAFDAADGESALNAASERWKGWQEKWKQERALDEAVYAECDGRIRDAHDAAEARVVNGERAVERRRKSEEAETAKKKVVEAFDKAADNDAFAEASEDWKKWRGEIGNDDYNAHDGQIQTARDAAGTRIALIKNQKVQACSAEVDELAAAFARVKARNDLRQPKESWQKWQGRWAAQIDGKVYQGFDQRIRTSHDDAERRVAIAESSEAAKKIADAFARVPDRAGLAVADDVYTAWQNTWRLKLAAAAYAGLDEEIREARTAAARRIADAEAAERAAALKKACEESATKLKGDFQSATDEAGLAAAEKALQAWRDEWRPQKVDGYAGLDEEVQACRNTADARVSCKTAAAKLGDVFGKANGREELEKADAAYRDWQKRWKDLSGEAWYAEADGGIAEARADAAARVEKAELARKVAACREAAAVVARAFSSVATRQELDKADAARREWQEKWKDLAGESGYKEADGGIVVARADAAVRVEKAELARKVAVCREAAAAVARAFGSVATRQELDKADATRRDWQGNWKDLAGEAGYKEADGGIAEARADAAARVEKAELARKVAACREAAAVVARAFGSVATRQELDKADAARREWQEKWKDLAGESGYKEADGGIAGARTNAERRLAEIERKRKGILKVYGAAMKDEPVASRRKRLEDVKGMLEASRKEKLFAEEETGRRLAEIEARLAWTAGEIVNRTGGPLSIGGTNVAAGATATVVFKEGASWTVTRHGYDPVTVNRETLDGKKVTLADDAFTPSDVLVKPPQGLDAGVVCELDGKDVPVSGKAVKPGQYTCAYRRAGYDRREGLRFTVKIGETDARFPNPGAWVASPVEVAVPKLPDDVACKMTLDGEVRKVDGTLKLRPGREYSCVYMRAGYYEQKKPFELSVGVNSVLPAPTEWTPLPVKVTVPPDLPPDVSCEVAGTAYRTGEVFELTPKGQPYEYAYRKTDYEDQPRRLIVEVNQPLTLPSPEDWLPTAGLRNLLDAEKAVNDRDWDGAEGFLKNADVRGQDNKKRKTRLETQVANSKMWGRTLDEIDNLIQNKSDESAGRDSIYTLEKYQQIVKLEYRLSGDDEKKIREMYQSGKEDLERKSSSERMGKSAKEYLKKLEGLFEELLPGEKP